jgi:GAF domain-containing protein
VLAQTREAVAAAALAGNSVVVGADLAEEGRWPDYAQMMTRHTPIRSVQAQPVVLAGTPLGVLVLYSDRPGHFAAERCDLGGMLAGIGAIALSLLESRHKTEHLTLALQNSREIGQAIGILMASHKITSEKAFELLRTASQHGHLKLREVAREVTLTGQLPVVEEGSAAIG